MMLDLPRRSLALSALLGLLAPALLSAQTVKLNGPLAQPHGGDILRFDVSPDGTRAVYLADQALDGTYELFATKPSAGSPAVRIAGPEIEQGDVTNFWIGPQGRRVVLIGKLLDVGVTELFSVAIDGGVVQRLSAPMPLGGNVLSTADSVQITPDESRVVYAADQDQNNVNELFSVPIAGGTPVQLNPELPGQQVRSFHLSPDGAHVVFRVLHGAAQVNELYAVPVAGGTAVKLSPDGRDTGVEYLIDGSNARAVFAARTGVGQFQQLYARALDGSGAPLPLLADPVISISQLRSNLDGTRVACVLGNQQARLVSARTDGGGSLVLDVVSDGFVYPSLTLTPDGATAVYVTLVPGGLEHLRRAALDGTVPAADIDLPNGGVFELSPDGQHVLYASGSLSIARLDLATPPLELAPDFPARFAFGPAGQRVVFTSKGADNTGSQELFSVPAAGGKAPTQLTPPFVFGGNVDESAALAFRVSALGRVVYVADLLEDERFELFGVPVAGGNNVRLSTEMPIGPIEGDVLTHVVTADGHHAVYLADETQNDRPELFSSRTDGTTAPVPLHPLEDGEIVSAFDVTPDGSTVVFWIDDGSLDRELRAVPVGGGTSLLLFGPGHASPRIALDPTSTRALVPLESAGTISLASIELDGLSPPTMLDVGQQFGTLRFTPDGSRALYLETTDGNTSLRSVPTDGSAGALTLDQGHGFQSNSDSVTPDGAQALYIADGLTPGQFEAFVVPLDVSALPRRLNAPLPALGAVLQVRAVGAFAFYVASQDSPDRRELYRVPLDGSAPAVKLNAPLVAGGHVTLFAVTPDGARVVYHADQEVNERYELYGAPADGSGPVAKLNPPVGQGDVGGDLFFDDLLRDVFALSPDGARVAFRADATRPGARELFVAPTDGSAPARRVSRPASTGDTVLGGYAFAPSGAEIAFTAVEGWFDGGQAVSVFHARTDAQRPAKRVDTGSFDAFFRRPFKLPLTLLPDGRRLVYSLDAETRSVVELFSATLGRLRPQDAPTEFRTRKL
jgi:Tol biopolymer transport system component